MASKTPEDNAKLLKPNSNIKGPKLFKATSEKVTKISKKAPKGLIFAAAVVGAYAVYKFTKGSGGSGGSGSNSGNSGGTTSKAPREQWSVDPALWIPDIAGSH